MTNGTTRGYRAVLRSLTHYRKRLETVFAKVAPTRRTFRNSTNSPMFELFFGAGNPIGAKRAVPIADHILKYL